MGYQLGVDLGTTFVAAAIANGTQVEMFTLGDRTVVTPAVVYLTDDGRLVSGDAANRRAVSNADRIGREFKRRLGDPTPVLLGDTSYPVTTLLGTLLHDVVEKVTETEGSKPDNVVLTHPANWGPFRRELFEEVPQVAGLTGVRTVTEPEAAAAHYAASRHLADGEIIAVYDLGGGTFDATVLRKHPSGIEILGSPEGIERLGGVDFDEAILSYVNYSSGGALSELDLSDPQTTVAMARLRQDCVLAKESLSADTETTIPVFLPHRHFDVQLTRSEFEDMIRAPVESTIGTLARTLRSAQVDPSQLSAVLLVGGSSRIPLISRMISEELGRPTVVDAHPKYAVALGAATLAREGGGLASSTGDADPSPYAPTSYAASSSPTALYAPGGGPSWESAGAAPAPALASGPAAALLAGPLPSATPVPVNPTQAFAPPSPDLPTDPNVYGGSSGGSGGAGGGFAPPMAGAGDGFAPPAAGSGWQPSSPSGPPPVPPRGGGRSGRGDSGRGDSGGGRSGGPGKRNPLIAIAVGLAVVVALLVVPGYRVLFGSDSTVTEAPPSGATAAAPEPGPAPAGGGAEEAPAPPADIATSVPIPSLGATIPAGPTPGFVVISPNGRQAYVANRNAGLITVIDTTVNQPIATINIPTGPPQYLAFAPSGRTLYASIWNDARTIAAIAVIDTTTNTVLTTIPVQTRPFLAAVTPNGQHLYVPNHDSGTITVIDTNTNKITTEIKVAPNPHWVEFSRDGTRAYTANHESNVISVLDTATNTVLTTIPVQKSPHSLAVHPTRPLVANVNYDANTVTMIDTNTNTVTNTIQVGKNPQDITWAPDGRHAYTANITDNTVSVINADTMTVTATLPTGKQPTSIAVTPNGTTAYVTNLGDNNIRIINIAG